MSQNFLYMEDVLAEEGFLGWYFKDGSQEAESWEKWMNEHPEKRSLVNEAIVFLEELPKENWIITRDRIDTKLNELRSKIDTAETRKPAPIVPFLNLRSRWMTAAAAVILLLAGIFIFIRVNQQPSVIRTPYATTCSKTLPDGSTMILNGNSNATLSKDWKKDGDREVWLEGEAFFRVKPNADQVPFKVHLSGKTSIEARSAEFNVSDVRDNCTVFLKSGEITFHIPNKELPNVNLKPGQVLVLDKETDKVYLEKAGNAEKYHDWIHKK